MDDFYVYLLKGQEVSKDLRSSTGICRESPVTVIHFYDGS